MPNDTALFIDAAAALDGAGKGSASAEFVTPAACTLLRLSLDYTRVKGTVRIEGAVHLRSARLELLP